MWTDERVELLVKLYKARVTASTIARQMGGFEHTADGGRSAVLGKIHRLGLAGKRFAPKPTPKRVERSVSRVPGTPKPNRLPPQIPAVPYLEQAEQLERGPRRNLLDLERDDCHWPIGDPQALDFGFCASKATPGLSYCAAHAHRAFQAPLPKTREIRQIRIKETV